MKVLVGTDFHSKESVFKNFAEKAEKNKVDVILICGDITHFGNLQEACHLLSLLAGPKVPVLFVPGNCDPPSLVGAEMKEVICIHGRDVSYGDLTFLGIGASPPTPFNTPFEMAEDKITETLNRAFSNLPVNRWFILVSHSPPWNTRLDKTSFGVHAGSISLRKFIEKKQPSLVFCGHIHEAKGRDKIGRTVIINPGPARYGNYAIAQFDTEFTIELDMF